MREKEKPEYQAYGSFERKKKNVPKVLKVFQDVKSRWDSTSYMLTRYRLLKSDLKTFLHNEAPYLQLKRAEWSQVEYLIDIVKPFCAFTQLIGATKTPTIHQVFKVYERLFNHLDDAKDRLQKKRVPWKVEMRDSIDEAWKKLSKYYQKTQTSLGGLYGKAILLDPKTKDEIFRSWDEATDWTAHYWDLLRKDFDRANNDPARVASETSENTESRYSRPQDLDAFLDLDYDVNRAPSSIDEFELYKSEGKVLF